VASKILPFRSPRNLRHCHYLKGIRNINRIECKEWEPGISKMVRGVEKQRLAFANQFYHAPERVQALVEEGRRREEKLQAATMVLASTQSTQNASSESSSACTPGRSIPAPALAWRSARRSCSDTVDGSGLSLSPERDPRFISPFRVKKMKNEE
jgi:hypothetical protein